MATGNRVETLVGLVRLPLPITDQTGAIKPAEFAELGLSGPIMPAKAPSDLFFILFLNPVFLLLGRSPMVEVKLRMYVGLSPSRTIGNHV